MSDIVELAVRLDAGRKRHIIRLFTLAELRRLAENAIQDFGCRLPLLPGNRRNQSLFAELFAVAAFAFSRLGNAVGKQEYGNDPDAKRIAIVTVSGWDSPVQFEFRDNQDLARCRAEGPSTSDTERLGPTQSPGAGFRRPRAEAQRHGCYPPIARFCGHRRSRC